MYVIDDKKMTTGFFSSVAAWSPARCVNFDTFPLNQSLERIPVETGGTSEDKSSLVVRISVEEQAAKSRGE